MCITTDLGDEHVERRRLGRRVRGVEVRALGDAQPPQRAEKRLGVAVVARRVPERGALEAQHLGEREGVDGDGGMGGDGGGGRRARRGAAR